MSRFALLAPWPAVRRHRICLACLTAPDVCRVQPTTKNRLDLGLRLEGQKPGGLLQPSKIHETMKLQISLTLVEQVDAEVLRWLRQAYDENC